MTNTEAVVTERAEGPSFDLWTIDDLENLPLPGWLIDEVLPKESVGVMYGLPATGKSFLALDMALHIATGQQWNGHAVTSGSVVYVAGEGANGYLQRIKAWMKSRRYLSIDNFFMATDPVQLHEPAQIDALAASVVAIDEAPSLIVIDTLARCFLGEDENNAGAMTSLIAGAERLARRFKAGVLLVHHSRKDGQSERGSIALRGGVEYMMSVTRAPNGILTLENSKMKNAAEFDAQHFRLAPVDDSCIIESCSAPPARRRDPSPTQKRCLDVLGTGPMTYGDWYRVAQGRGISKTAFDKSRAALVDRGLVIKDERGYFPAVDE